MGRQVNFYMDGTDEETFLKAAAHWGELRYLLFEHSTERYSYYENIPDIHVRGSFQIYLWNPNACKPPVLRSVHGRPVYVIDVALSEVIEFSRSYERDDRLVRGRLWAELAGWDRDSPSRTFEKSIKFRTWFEHLARWIRKNYEREQRGDYVGPGALQRAHSGRRLVQADFAKIVKLVQH